MGTGISDDYAHGEFGEYHFYFGYEKTICPLHGNDTQCCDRADWAFVVTKNSAEVYRTTAKGLKCKQYDEPVEVLLKGIFEFGKTLK